MQERKHPFLRIGTLKKIPLRYFRKKIAQIALRLGPNDKKRNKWQLHGPALFLKIGEIRGDVYWPHTFTVNNGKKKTGLGLPVMTDIIYSDSADSVFGIGFAPWASHNIFLKTIEFQMGAVRVS
jgi:hypothetical protein